MQYRTNPKTGEQISALAFGCMRFHRDEAEVERQIRYAIEQGINYFDTAYIYPGSEATLGRILAKDGLRSRVNIADKLPYYLVRKQTDFDRLFQTQLTKLQTDYIDYYMVHMLPGLASWEKLCQIGILDWIQEKKAGGAIRQMGFSFHGSGQDFIDLIDAWDWDFTMIQYNYYDEHFQAGRRGLEYAAERGIPVMVMEPLRGGTLVHQLPPATKAVWETAPGERSPAEWALRWVWNHPQVLTALSGMTTMEMLEENIRVASQGSPGHLTDQELALYDKASGAIRAALKSPCTGCGYCMPCPAGVDIPLCLTKLNDIALGGRLMSMYWYAVTGAGKNASLCNGCGKCEQHCPQGIPIRKALQQTVRELERFPYGVIRFITRKILKKKK